jgi:deazaflavin-dependent oxidoreductase (nitroreductase family)
MMRLPGLGRLLGRSFAVITVNGAKTGNHYSTPVQYMKIDNEYVVLSQRHRMWWRNIRSRPDVNLEVGGKTMRGIARIPLDPEAQELLSTCLMRNPRVAKFYGMTPDNEGFDPADIAHLAQCLVPIVIRPLTKRLR